LVEQDRATRAGEGWTRKLDLMGYGLQGKTLGLVGIGNVGSEVARLAAPFGLKIIATDPYASPERAEAVNAALVDLDTLLAEADYVVILCALTDETRNMIDESKLAKMKPTAFLINTARGAVVEQSALEDALAEGVIAGAGLDVLDPEPPSDDARILGFSNVILSPHALAWTDQCFAAIGAGCVSSMQAVSAGEAPANVVNGAVLTAPAFRAKLAKRKGSIA
jgi:D-3-phosphoglycerate dehydrogenase